MSSKISLIFYQGIDRYIVIVLRAKGYVLSYRCALMDFRSTRLRSTNSLIVDFGQNILVVINTGTVFCTRLITSGAL